MLRLVLVLGLLFLAAAGPAMADAGLTIATPADRALVLQFCLKADGFYHGAIDGIHGPQTAAALLAAIRMIEQQFPRPPDLSPETHVFSVRTVYTEHCASWLLSLVVDRTAAKLKGSAYVW